MKSLVGIGVLAFFSCLLFGGGAFLHAAKAPAQSAGTAAPVKAAHGKAKAAKPAAADPAPAAGENSMAFPLMLAGGAGLFVSALAALGVCRSLSAPTPEAARRMREAERAAQRKQQEDSEATQAALHAQLAEARQRKTETEALRDQVSRQFQEFFRTLPVPCFCFAASGKIIRWNAACEALYGIPAAAALESTLWDTIVPSGERDDAEAKIRRVLAGESLLSAERTDTVAGGGQARLRCSLVPLRDAEGVIIGGLSAGVDVTEFAAAQAQIAALTAALEAAATQAETPPAPAEEIVRTPGAAPAESSPELSGHPAFRARLAEEIERAARYHAPLSLVLLDLDGFSARNRACGFEAGDAALDAAGAAIKSKIRTVDVLARLGADEYALILPETGEAGARVAADRLRAGIGGISLPGQPPLSACVGAALLSPEISGAAMLITRALDALNAARASGPGSVTHFQDLPQIVSARPAPDSPVPARPRRAAAKTPKM